MLDARIGVSKGACCGTGPFANGYIVEQGLLVIFVANRSTPVSAFQPSEQFGFLVTDRYKP